MKQIKIVFLSCIILSICWSCGDDPETSLPIPDPPSSDTTIVNPDTIPEEPLPLSIAKGADISYCTQMETEGRLFYSFSVREAQECTRVMKDLGMDAIRLSVLVNPVDGYLGLEDVIEKAVRACTLGMDLMIAFHYSDVRCSWSSQSIPEEWSTDSLSLLCKQVSEHTSEVLSALRDRNIPVRWIQIGNETSTGMLPPMGDTDRNSEGFRALFKAGSQAARRIYPQASIVAHLARGFDQTQCQEILDLIDSEDFDIIGLSLRPSKEIGETFRMVNGRVYRTISSQEECVEFTFQNMDILYNRYKKNSLIAELGLPASTEVASTSLMHTICNKAKESGICDGIFYWEPQTYPEWGNDLGAFLSNGRPTTILEAFE